MTSSYNATLWSFNWDTRKPHPRQWIRMKVFCSNKETLSNIFRWWKPHDKSVRRNAVVRTRRSRLRMRTRTTRECWKAATTSNSNMRRRTERNPFRKQNDNDDDVGLPPNIHSSSHWLCLTGSFVEYARSVSVRGIRFPSSVSMSFPVRPVYSVKFILSASISF